MKKNILDLYSLWNNNNPILEDIGYNMFEIFGECSNLYYNNEKLYFLYLAGKSKYSNHYLTNRGNYKNDKEYIMSYDRMSPQKIRITSFIVIIDLNKFVIDSSRTIIFLKDSYLEGKNQYLIKELHEDLNSSVVKNLTRPFQNYTYSNELTGFQYNYILNIIKYSIDSKLVQIRTKKNIAKVLNIKANAELIDQQRFINRFLIGEFVDHHPENKVYIPNKLKRPYDFFIQHVRRKLKPTYIELLLRIIDDNSIIETFTEKDYKIIKNSLINYKTVYVLEKICLCMFNNVRDEYYYNIKFIFDAIKISLQRTQYYYDSKNLPF